MSKMTDNDYMCSFYMEKKWQKILNYVKELPATRCVSLINNFNSRSLGIYTATLEQNDGYDFTDTHRSAQYSLSPKPYKCPYTKMSTSGNRHFVHGPAVCKDSLCSVAYLFPLCAASDEAVAVKEVVITLFAGF
jgi:hypothetical protein